MKGGILLEVAWRSLVRSRVTFALLVLAVACGVGFQIPNTANLDGYTAELLRQGLGRDTGHVQVSPAEGDVLPGAHALAALLRKLPLVAHVTIRLTHAGVLMTDERHFGARIVGVEPEAEEASAGFCSRIAAGACLGRTPGLVLGNRIAEKMAVKLGDKVKLVLPYEDLGDVALASHFLPVTGIMSAGGGFSADSDVFVPLTLLQNLRDAGDDPASTVSLFLSDEAAITDTIEATQPLAPGALIQGWREVNGFVASAVDGNRTLAAISGAMSILAVSIPALALFTIHVMRERRKIAILSAIGFSRADVFVIYVLKACILGALGILPGIAMGAAVCAYFGANPIYAHDGFVIRPELTLPAVLIPSVVIFATTVVAGLLPAFRAARANPALTLRDSG